LKNVGPIRHCEPPHAVVLHCHSPGVATVARRLPIATAIDVHNNNDDNNDNTWQRGPLWPHRMGPIDTVFTNCIIIMLIISYLRRGMKTWSLIRPESRRRWDQAGRTWCRRDRNSRNKTTCERTDCNATTTHTHTHTHTHTLVQVTNDWVLSHWVHFTVHSLDLVLFICVYFVFFCVVLLSAQCGGPNGIEAWCLGLLFLQCFDTVGWVFWPIKPVPVMMCLVGR